GHVADAAAQRAIVADGIETEDRGATGISDEQRHQNTKERRLAGAVGADEAEQLAFFHRERHPVERHRALEPLRDPLAAHDAHGTNWTSTGMPIFSTPSWFGTR